LGVLDVSTGLCCEYANCVTNNCRPIDITNPTYFIICKNLAAKVAKTNVSSKETVVGEKFFVILFIIIEIITFGFYWQHIHILAELSIVNYNFLFMSWFNNKFLYFEDILFVFIFSLIFRMN